ncbi:MAG TPA: type VI secretion system tip protein TssI/VgrG, partial [Candidatus Nanopelagicales bacterium]|nr:type VI secretion system tip protein TssI/VgrG [Candidatus Nanopelagicales bacterium]
MSSDPKTPRGAHPGDAAAPLKFISQQGKALAGALGDALGARAAQFELQIASGDALDVRQFSIHERLSALFTVSLIALSDNPDISFDDVVGQPARFTLRRGDHTRTFTGICNHLQQIRVEEQGASTYELTIVPTLWLLTQRRNYRMFQQESELEIVKKLLDEWTIPFEEKLTETYKPRKYRVQYGETDYSFLCRMLEDAGITHYFQDTGDTDEDTKLILADAPQSNPLREPKIAFRDNPTTAADKDHVTAVRISQRVRPGRYTMKDHDYRRPPSYKLMKTAESPKGGIESKLERFHYTPGAFLFRAD